MLMRLIVSSALACPILQYFSALSHIRHDFRGGKKKKEQIFFFLLWRSLQLLPEIFIVLKRNVRDIINVHRYSCKVPVIFVRFFKKTWIFLTDFLKILKRKILWKSVQWDSNSTGRTDTGTGRQARWSWWSLFAILRTRLNMGGAVYQISHVPSWHAQWREYFSFTLSYRLFHSILCLLDRASLW